jgi:predicted dienelactone hydrolase
MNARFSKLLLSAVLIVVLALPALALPMFVSAQEGGGPPRVGLFPDSPQYALHGSYWVGTREFVIEPDSERPLPVTVWYPAMNGDFVPEEVNYTYAPLVYRPVTVPGHAIADAYPDFTSAPYPLVVVMHDNYMTRFAMLYLTEHLASQGFVVMAAQRTGTGTGDTLYFTPQDVENTADSLVYGPADIQRQIDFASTLAAPQGGLPGLIDVEHIAVVGHASAGDTALTAAGARIGLGPVSDWCSSNADDPAINTSFDYYLWCGVYLASEQRLLAMRQVETQPGEVWPAFEVTGVDAVVSLSAHGFNLEGGDVSGVTVPALVVYGDLFPDHAQWNRLIYDGLSSAQKALVVFEHGSLALTEEPCDSLQAQASYFVCFQEQVWDLNRAHDLVNHFTTAFLLATLKGDTDAAAVLTPDAVSFPGITYETTGF